MRVAKINFFVLILTLLGGVLHFYNILWGAPFFFHPDERNIAASITQLAFPMQINPHFFAYGSFPIYLTYFSALVTTDIYSRHVDFVQAIMLLRFFSATLATLLIPSLYFIGRKLHNITTGLIAAMFGVFSSGFIQFAHFGTFEMWLTFFALWIFYFSVLLFQKPTTKHVLITAILCGLAIATKVSMIVLIALPTLIIVLFLFPITQKNVIRFILRILLFMSTATAVYLLTNPFILLDFTSFLGSMRYESTVALGSLPVFYTGEFIHTIPIAYQFLHVYPFLINPLLTLLIIPTLLFTLWKGIQKKHMPYLLLIFCFFLLFLSQAFFYVKWIRYMMPTLPFIYLIISIAITQVLKNLKTVFRISSASWRIVFGTIVLVSIIFSLSYFYTVYLQPDTRVAAAQWALQHIPTNAKISSEVYDLGIIPFNPYFTHISLVNTYDLDARVPPLSSQDILYQSEYIILPSQRIFQSRLTNATAFPNGAALYQSLLKETSGFTKIYQTPCDSICTIAFFGNPIFSFEQTATVFDRPIVMIYKKISN